MTTQQMHASDRGQAKDGNGLTVAVVGGGITGLAAAWQLVTTLPRGARVVLLEADERLGGKLLTGEIGGRPVDLGPDAFLARRPEAAALCHDLGLGADLVPPGASGAFVWARGALRQLPSGLALGLPTRMGPLARSGICSPMGLGRAALDLLRPSAPPRRKSAGEAQDDNDDDYDESVGSVVRRRLGTEVHDLLADPLIGGIHAGPIDTMSAAAVFPALLRAERQPGSLMKALRPMAPPPAPRPERRAVPPLAATGDLRAADAPAPSERAPVFLTVRGGLGRIVERSEQELTARGADIRVGVRVENIHMSTTTPGPPRWSITTSRGTLEVDGVVVAVPATAASGLLGRLDPSLAGLLSGIPYGSVTLVTLRFPKSRAPLRSPGNGLPGARGQGTARDRVHLGLLEMARARPSRRRALAGLHGPLRRRPFVFDVRRRSRGLRPEGPTPDGRLAWRTGRDGGDPLAGVVPPVPGRAPPALSGRWRNAPHAITGWHLQGPRAAWGGHTGMCRQWQRRRGRSGGQAGPGRRGDPVTPGTRLAQRWPAAPNEEPWRDAGPPGDHRRAFPPERETSRRQPRATNDHQVGHHRRPRFSRSSGSRGRPSRRLRWFRILLPALAAGAGLTLSLPPVGVWVLAFPAAGAALVAPRRPAMACTSRGRLGGRFGALRAVPVVGDEF